MCECVNVILWYCENSRMWECENVVLWYCDHLVENIWPWLFNMCVWFLGDFMYSECNHCKDMTLTFRHLCLMSWWLRLSCGWIAGWIRLVCKHRASEKYIPAEWHYSNKGFIHNPKKSFRIRSLTSISKKLSNIAQCVFPISRSFTCAIQLTSSWYEDFGGQFSRARMKQVLPRRQLFGNPYILKSKQIFKYSHKIICV